jgi:hypothetical protein
MLKERPLTEDMILEKVVGPTDPDLSAEAARGLLGFKFDRATTQTIRKLLQKNNRGTISAEERLALEKFMRVGQFLDLVHAKARISLRKNKRDR